MSAMVLDSENTKVVGKVAPWVEKYRPEKVDDISHQDEVVKTLKKSIQTGNLPHLLFHGPPGTGKTTTILAVVKALYGPELYRTRIMELNASDERGIKVVREKIKNFAQGAVGGQKMLGYPCPRYKVIILDEVDTMTPEAQAALRRIIEAFSKVTRFCLICNYVTRVIEPLASRCAKFRFKSLPIDSMMNRISEIAEKEGVKLDESTLQTLLEASKGDMRKAVTYLQSAHQLTAGSSSVSSYTIIDISGQVPPEDMDKLWGVMSGMSFDLLRAVVSDLIMQGFPLSSLLSQLHDMVVVKTELSDLDKALICEKIAEVDLALVDGASESIQLMDLTAFISRRLTKFKAMVDAKSQSHA